MRLSLHFLSWRAVAAVEQGVAEGLGWGSAKAGVFLWELTRCTRVFTGFSEISLTKLSAARIGQSMRGLLTSALPLLALSLLKRKHAVAQWQSTSARSSSEQQVLLVS